MRCQYKTFNFRTDTLARIALCNKIVQEYQGQGLRLTLRQLYYQLVSRNVIPNTEKSYKSLGKTVSEGRLAGMIDWDAIEDRNREPVQWAEYENLEQLIESTKYRYRLPRWEGQRNYVELWVEKAALAGVLRPLASKYHVTLMVNRGYSSQSAMYESAQRFLEHGGQKPILFYLGDHDPSGEDMVRDIYDRLVMFGVNRVEVRKLALTMEQVQEYQPPPNPAKMTDSRAPKYVEEHGSDSWEVDALNPVTLAQIIESAFKSVTDMAKMGKIIRREKRELARLGEMLPKFIGRLEKAVEKDEAEGRGGDEPTGLEDDDSDED